MKLLRLCLLLFFITFSSIVFSQIRIDSIGKLTTKKIGFYLSPETLYLNSTIENIVDKQKKDSAYTISNALEKTLNFRKNKLFFCRNNNSFFSYFAYSDGNSVYFNSNNYKNDYENSNYFIKSIRWRDYYFFEEQFIHINPGGFLNYGFSSFPTMDIFFNGNIIVQNMFCSFDVKLENFFCIEKQEIRKRLKKKYPEVFLKYRKSNKNILNYIESLQEIESIDSTGVEKITH